MDLDNKKSLERTQQRKSKNGSGQNKQAQKLVQVDALEILCNTL